MTVGWFRAPTETDEGTLNACYAGLDRPVILGRSDDLVVNAPKPITFAKLLEDVAAFGGVLKGVGVVPGEVVIIDLDDDLATVIARLACARLGAVSTPDVTSAAAVIITSHHEAISTRLKTSEQQPRAVVVQDGVELDPTRDLDWAMSVKAGRTDPAPCADLPAGAAYSPTARTLDVAESLVTLTKAPVSLTEFRAALEI